MRYGELIRFDPIESVIQLRNADDVQATAMVSNPMNVQEAAF